MSRTVRVLFVAAAVVALCAAPRPATPQAPAPLPPPPIPTSPTIPGPGAPVPASADCDRCGTVQSISRTTAKDQWTPLGSVSASPLGTGDTTNPSAVTMYQIGKGFSKQGTVLVGAAGGAAYQTRPRELNTTRWEVVVRMDAGGTRSVTQNYEPMLREGDHVRVMGSQLELVQ